MSRGTGALMLIALTGALLLQSCGKTHPEVKRFYKAHRKDKGVVNVTLPKWMIWLGGGLAANAVAEEEISAFMPLLKKVHKVRLLISEEEEMMSPATFERFRQRLSASGFEEYIRIRDGKTRFQFMIRPEGEQLKDIVLFFLDEGESGMIALRSGITPDRIAASINDFLQTQKKKRKEEEEKRLLEALASKKKIPQV